MTQHTISLDRLRGDLDPAWSAGDVARDIDRRRIQQSDDIAAAATWDEKRALLAQSADFEREHLYVMALRLRIDAVHGRIVDGRFVADEPMIRESDECAHHFELTHLLPGADRTGRLEREWRAGLQDTGRNHP